MEEDYWLRYGLKEDGRLICTRVISKTKPSKTFFYTENGTNKEVKNAEIIKLSLENLNVLSGK
ncbi:hypothetical protein JXB41_00795 [Candidatus Woesearchaeota archaeon]|nr:hypothetical protein [Candidatus Woesearchaeota archaeon]